MCLQCKSGWWSHWQDFCCHFLLLNGVNAVRNDHTHSNDRPPDTYKNLYIKNLHWVDIQYKIRTVSVICRFLYAGFTADLPNVQPRSLRWFPTWFLGLMLFWVSACRILDTIGKVIILISFWSLHSDEAAWPSGWSAGLAIRKTRVQVPFWPLAGFAHGSPNFKSSAMLVNSQLVCFRLVGIRNPLSPNNVQDQFSPYTVKR